MERDGFVSKIEFILGEVIFDAAELFEEISGVRRTVIRLVFGGPRDEVVEIFAQLRHYIGWCGHCFVDVAHRNIPRGFTRVRLVAGQQLVE
ncbi:hypothetical protein QP228_007975 [Pseudoglutamicibacter cumminsii]|uniref:hypothetical protein n=1 Tax=Pseudoglutamicibacter cumminsii TaxID=156979 RepID=UPI002ABB8F5F|nr:hypothetical protein [Pseudoglutamicibacter cumminsii]MDZ3745908.1 hypothetical protein [Pseudoglutamicibacter cumminsii]